MDGPLSRLSKSQAVELLSALGIAHSSTETVPELRLKLQDWKRAHNTSTVDAQIRKMSTMRKTDLQEHVKSLGVAITGNEIVARLLQMARQHLEYLTQETPGAEQEDFTFTWGKCKGKTYRWAMDKDPKYCNRAKKTLEEDPEGCSLGLKKFVQFMNKVENPQTHFEGLPKMKMEQHKPRPKSAASAAQTPIPGDDAEEDEEELMSATLAPPQWDGNPENLESFVKEAQIWHAMNSISLPSSVANSVSSWHKVAPMDTTNKNVHLLEAKTEGSAQKRATTPPTKR